MGIGAITTNNLLSPRNLICLSSTGGMSPSLSCELLGKRDRGYFCPEDVIKVDTGTSRGRTTRGFMGFLFRRRSRETDGSRKLTMGDGICRSVTC